MWISVVQLSRMVRAGGGTWIGISSTKSSHHNVAGVDVRLSGSSAYLCAVAEGYGDGVG